MSGRSDDVRREASGERRVPPVARSLWRSAPAALEVGVDLALEADPRLVRAKSLRMSELFLRFAATSLPGFGVASPRDPAERGSQVCLTHPDAAAIVRRQAGRGIVGDFRPPDVLRFAIAPLTLRYVELGRVLAALAAG